VKWSVCQALPRDVDANHGYAYCKPDSTRESTDTTTSGVVWTNPLRWSNAFIGGDSHGANSTTSALIGARFSPSTGSFDDLLAGAYTRPLFSPT